MYMEKQNDLFFLNAAGAPLKKIHGAASPARKIMKQLKLTDQFDISLMAGFKHWLLENNDRDASRILDNVTPVNR